MAAMKRPRFTLRFLFILLGVAAAFLGYAQWRHQRLMREARELESHGFTLLWQETWTNWIWPFVPKEARFEYYKLSGGKWKFGSDIYGDEEVADKMYLGAIDRLHALDVEYVRMDRDGHPSQGYTRTTHGPNYAQ